ncbi:hypothetical protein EUTSA_v10017627mg [Eutrema salsugineum]|uniref:Neprosin PEP catalytic domain-containing protein n=1 Tax=Eutrema salsugineum TaxID=72664 RepID=V4LM35_EUTSA|nr:uncharacterized protein LOC18026616 [Eutrema salsugineum]ESQ51595.1 hypothetical protein EUTSA_v10017627mg [Eutrema salsugineum]
MTVTFVLNILIIAAIVTGGEFSDIPDVEIDRLLKKLNKPALKSIKSPNGDIIDCVHLKNHPIYDHPLFKNHTIQMRPSSYLERWNNESSNMEKKSMVNQMWTRNGHCPKNSIPIRRTKKEDILRAGSIERYFKKYPNNIPRHNPANSYDNYTHEYAILKVDGKFHGAQAVINVWKPYVQTPKEFSLTQTWLAAGPYEETNTIEFGWQVYPGRYGDDNLRIFIYWTSDGYNKKGCYNLDCPGFVQVNGKFSLGETVFPVSIIDGKQYNVPVTIFKDPRSGHWWLKLAYHMLIGYWPSTLFNHLGNGATEINWGGEIINFNENSQHTTTTMGSGRFAKEGFRRASYFRDIQTFDEDNNWEPIDGAYSYMTDENCYSLQLDYEEIGWGDYFFYGGPGRNQKCV